MPNSAPCQIMHPLVLVGLGVGVGEGLGLGVGLGLGNQVAISTRGCIIHNLTDGENNLQFVRPHWHLESAQRWAVSVGRQLCKTLV